MNLKLILQTILIITVFSLTCEAQVTMTDTTISYIKSQSLNGRLDFQKKLIDEGKENKLLLYDGVAYSPEDFSILLWGKAVRRLGVSSIGDARGLWEEIYGKEMSGSDKKALKKGYNSPD
jgi:hypothetical protein